jgi:multidrug resistance efflux pump
MDDTVESLKAALAVEKAARQKAEASLATARRIAEQQASRITDDMEPSLAAAQKRVEALEGALRVCFDFACEGWARNSPFVRDTWLGFKQAETIRSVLDAAPAALASPSESAPHGKEGT